MIRGFTRPASLFGRCLLLASCASSFACSGSDAKKNNDACTPDDADGIVAEPAELLVMVSDTGFSPRILATQNTSPITLTLENRGTRPHGFVIDCKPTPNADGCPMQSCFPSEAKIAPVAPGEQTTVMFESPLVEGIYDFHSDLPEDAELESGQYIIL